MFWTRDILILFYFFSFLVLCHCISPFKCWDGVLISAGIEMVLLVDLRCNASERYPFRDAFIGLSWLISIVTFLRLG